MSNQWQYGRYLGLVLLSVGLIGCAALHVPEGKSPGQPRLVQQPLFHASDGTELFITHWRPQAKAKAIILLMHGFNEYPGAFDEVGKDLAAHAMDVWAFDQRGFGRTPYRGLWSNAERMAADVREMTGILHKAQPQLPLYVLGASMGGAVTLLAASQQPFEANGIILAAPAVWTRASQPFYQRWALEVSAKVVPGWAPTGESLDKKPSDNKAMLKRIWKSPWMIRQSRMDTVAGLVDLMDKGAASAPVISVPVLLLYGEKDQIIPKKPIELLWSKLPKGGKTQFIRYAEGWHMLMRDKDGAEVIEDIVNWVQAAKPITLHKADEIALN